LRGNRHRQKREGPCQGTIGVDRNYAKILAGDGILVFLPDESEAVARHEIVDSGRIDSILALILLNRADILLAPEDEFLFDLAPRLHDPERDHHGGDDRSGRQNTNHCGKRKPCIAPRTHPLPPGEGGPGEGGRRPGEGWFHHWILVKVCRRFWKTSSIST
jgi:hypothetical protein